MEPAGAHADRTRQTPGDHRRRGRLVDHLNRAATPRCHREPVARQHRPRPRADGPRRLRPDAEAGDLPHLRKVRERARAAVGRPSGRSRPDPRRQGDADQRRLRLRGSRLQAGPPALAVGGPRAEDDHPQPPPRLPRAARLRHQHRRSPVQPGRLRHRVAHPGNRTDCHQRHRPGADAARADRPGQRRGHHRRARDRNGRRRRPRRRATCRASGPWPASTTSC